MSENIKIPIVPSLLSKKNIITVLVCLIVVSSAYIILVVLGPYKYDPLASRREILFQPNPPANLTESEISARRGVINIPNPPSQLTPEQIKARQEVMGNN